MAVAPSGRKRGEAWVARSRTVVMLAILAVAVGLVVAVDIFPVLTNDSLAYIGHSNSLVDTGAVQIGYRLAGYPIFLAMVDWMASALRVEPLLLAALIQRIVLLAGVACAVWLWRWSAAPLVLLAITPSFLAYSNLVLTEGLGVGLAVWYGITVVASLVGVPPRVEARWGSSANRWVSSAVAIASVVIFTLLVMIRFHYILLGVGAGAVLLRHVADRTTRRAAVAAGTAAALVLGGFLAVASVENRDEYGAFFPSVKGERSQFWSAWMIAFDSGAAEPTEAELNDLWGEGNPYTTMYRIDALPTYGEQQSAYSEAILRLFGASGSSIWEERVQSFGSVLAGSRIDDVRGLLTRVSTTRFENVENAIFANAVARERGVEYVEEAYNDGREIEPIMTSPLAPWRSVPYFHWLLRVVLIVSFVSLTVGLAFRRTRGISVVGIATALVVALVIGYYLMDNVRFVIVPYLFVVTVAAGAADAWFPAARTWISRSQ